jgi:cell division transport system permease protein
MNSAQIDHALIRTPVAWPLRIMIAIIVFIAGLGLLSAWALGLSAAQLDHGLRGQMTVEIALDAEGKIDSERMPAVLKELRAIKGVTTATPIDAKQMAALLGPWLGQGVLDAKSLAQLPVPQLIDLQVADPKIGSTITALLQKKFPDATLADHQQWVKQLARNVRWAASAMLLLVGVLLLALFSTVVFACRAGLNVQLPTVTLLHTIGATDAYICAQMQRYALRLVWPGCVLGVLACAAASVLLIKLVVLLAPNHYAPAQDTFWSGAVALGLCLPVLALVFARLSANLATQRVLLTMP